MTWKEMMTIDEYRAAFGLPLIKGGVEIVREGNKSGFSIKEMVKGFEAAGRVVRAAGVSVAISKQDKEWESNRVSEYVRKRNEYVAHYPKLVEADTTNEADMEEEKELPFGRSVSDNKLLRDIDV